MAKSFLYITNFSKRDYQFDISLASVKENTLVVIPTGLGKTFISAMVILNFYRWFPKGKILFLATSRPLVTQQMAGIRDILQIDKSEIIELTGSVEPRIRPQLWNKARVIFATPQTVQKDLEKGTCPASQIVLVVIDEAHHATGDHSYCKVVSGIAEYTKFFRVIGLSATPGSDKDIIQDVIYGLFISKIQYREEDEYKQYVKTRDIETVVVPNAAGVDELIARINTVIKRYLQVLSKDNLVPHTDPTRTTKGQIGLLMKNRNANEGVGVMISTMKLLKFREYLQNYSIKTFVDAVTEFITDKSTRDVDLVSDLQPILSAAQKQRQIDPKMEKLCEIVVDFLEATKESRIIIFCNFRNIVQDIVTALSSKSIVKVSEFIGQSNSGGTKGLNQSRQINLIQSFRRGIYNVLVATAIGEEGLDIGEVDLIICYDVQKSITRTIQRMGRTGRKRDGKVIFLLSDAQKNLSADSEHANNQVCSLLRRQMKDFVFYKDCPVMNPFDLEIVERTIKNKEEIQDLTSEKKSKNNIKRKTLTTDELAELDQRHGPDLIYKPLSLFSHSNLQSNENIFSIIPHSSETSLFTKISSQIFECKISSQSQQLFALQSSSSTQPTTSSQSDNQTTTLTPPTPYQMKSSFPIESQKLVSQKELEEPRKKTISELVFGFKMDSSTSSSDDDLFMKPDKIDIEKEVKESEISIRSNLLASDNLPHADVSSLRKSYDEMQKFSEKLEKSPENEIINPINYLSSDNEEEKNNLENNFVPTKISDQEIQHMVSDDSDVPIPPMDDDEKPNQKNNDEILRIYSTKQLEEFIKKDNYKKKQSSDDESFIFISESSDFVESDNEVTFCPPEKVLNHLAVSDNEDKSENEELQIPKSNFEESSHVYSSESSSDEGKNFIVESSDTPEEVNDLTRIPLNQLLGIKTQSQGRRVSQKQRPPVKKKKTQNSSSDFDLSISSD
ncbi:Type III restriction enzyme, res subunit family protein [Trichomonas vaginalis G3]|uniref:Type III restriction enzyme, res subunit family protein n=1 Tax=Trichomonas vaginalis (strain ATCC PRA-98 / G3) TaxID=412133 RepID=A2EWH8_TRIV3|nr:Fanconi anemia group M (FancM) family member family [Trichomonas vaginalis G3]EAY03005.1 Type III restriction enzyme, res subunit family protein [Trichomonas vaginalis G3]KAI5501784.1 Fanconi anemia group M (FancM) family member family [Trichomonas vaginalis G3]|eukprot:XP_001315228.1 Type III restriction enzyme, res subunit family protein [Trichomonas vaginalis G3]